MKIAYIVLILLNCMVLMGQLWPAGAPPFARVVNILTISLNLILILSLFKKGKS